MAYYDSYPLYEVYLDDGSKLYAKINTENAAVIAFAGEKFVNVAVGNYTASKWQYTGTEFINVKHITRMRVADSDML